jgi:hypothetical protein
MIKSRRSAGMLHFLFFYFASRYCKARRRRTPAHLKKKEMITVKAAPEALCGIKRR